MIGISCKFSNRQHVVIHPELEKWLKRQVPPSARDSLFVYFHTIERNYVIAKWTRPGFFVDVRNLGPHLYSFSAEDARIVASQLSDNYGGIDTKQLRRDALSGASDTNEYLERMKTYRFAS